MERLTLPIGLSFPKTAFEVSIEFDEHLENARAKELLPIPTGFAELDDILGGGLHPESLMLVGGPPGVGKTIFVMQAARNIAASGEVTACVVCFEHSDVYLYQRLLCMESALSGSVAEAVTLDDIREVMEQDNSNLEVLLSRSVAARQAWSRFTAYWERLYLIKGHPSKATLNVLDLYVTHLKAHGKRVVLFVDYLQKIPVPYTGMEIGSDRQIRLVTEGLKNLAMDHQIAIVAVAASDAEGLKKEHVKIQDLWGGPTIKYEPDVVVMLNPQASDCVCFEIEKNRQGPANTRVQYQLWGAQYVFLKQEMR